jgi:hypothetical protein
VALLLSSSDVANRTVIERSLLVATRTLEERGRMLDRMRRQALERGRRGEAERFEPDRDETVTHADVLRDLLLTMS